MYGPDFLVEKGVILASFNYRLGIMGFLSFNDPSVNVSGNAGLKDQSMALKWIKANIASFGGDPDNITLFGESAGAASVHYQCLSPASKGLFNRAILMSGCALNPWGFLDKNLKFALRLSQKLGYKGPPEDVEVFKFLNNHPLNEVAETTMSLLSIKEEISELGMWVPFVPTIDHDFITKEPQELARDAWSNDIDIMIGGCADEGLFYSRNLKSEFFNEFTSDSCNFLPHDLRKTEGISSEKIKNLYFNSSAEVSPENPKPFLDFNGDQKFWLGMHRTALQRLDRKGKTFLYRLDTPPGNGPVYKFFRFFMKIPHMNGTAHTDDLPLLFKSWYGDKPAKEETIYSTFVKFLTAFTQFAKTGDPNHEVLGATWEPLTKAKPFWSMNMAVDGWKMQDLPNKERIEAFESLYPEGKL